MSSLQSRHYKIFYGNVKNDTLNVDILIAGKVRGKVSIPLCEVCPNSGFLEWKICDLNGGQEVGSLVLSLDLANADKPSVKTCLNKQIHEMLFKNFGIDLFGSLSIDR